MADYFSYGPLLRRARTSVGCEFICLKGNGEVLGAAVTPEDDHQVAVNNPSIFDDDSVRYLENRWKVARECAFIITGECALRNHCMVDGVIELQTDTDNGSIEE